MKRSPPSVDMKEQLVVWTTGYPAIPAVGGNIITVTQTTLTSSKQLYSFVELEYRTLTFGFVGLKFNSKEDRKYNTVSHSFPSLNNSLLTS